jgi:hypothetical protein
VRPQCGQESSTTQKLNAFMSALLRFILSHVLQTDVLFHWAGLVCSKLHRPGFGPRCKRIMPGVTAIPDRGGFCEGK